MFWTTFFIIINIIFFIFYFFIYENTKTLHEICFDWRFGVTLFSLKFTKEPTFIIYCQDLSVLTNFLSNFHLMETFNFIVSCIVFVFTSDEFGVESYRNVLPHNWVCQASCGTKSKFEIQLHKDFHLSTRTREFDGT